MSSDGPKDPGQRTTSITSDAPTADPSATPDVLIPVEPTEAWPEDPGQDTLELP